MIGMIHNQPGEMPTLVGHMPAVPGLPTNANAPGVQLLGPPGWERAASTGTFWDRVAAKSYEIPSGGLGAPIVHGQGLGAPIAHGQGLGAWGAVSDADLDKMATTMAANQMLGVGDIADAMKLLTKDERDKLGVKLIALGVASSKVASAKVYAKLTAGPEFKKRAAIYGVLGTISMAASAYHGYKRNDSIGWSLWWGLMGAVFPVITPVIGVAQGFAKPKR